MTSQNRMPYQVRALLGYMFQTSYPDGFIEIDDGGGELEKVHTADKAAEAILATGAAELGWFYRTKGGAHHEWCRIILPPGVAAWEAVADFTTNGRIEAWLSGWETLADRLDRAPSWREVLDYEL